MKRLVQFELDEDTTLYVEVDAEPGDEQRVGRRGDEIEKAGDRFTAALAGIRPATEAVLQTFKEISTPDEIALEFGVKFGVKAGAILASVDSDATFKVMVKWRNKSET